MRAEKQLLLDEIIAKMQKSSAFVVTRYEKMQANSSAEFRKILMNAGGDFEVARKRIFEKAAEAAGIKLTFDGHGGHFGIVFAYGDSVGVTKAAFDFSAQNADMLEFVGGRFEGQPCTKADITQISNLPSRDEMRSQILGLLQAPLADVLATFNAILTSVPHCLANKVEQAGTNE
jgi:large subunit ribosomal protein L10